MACALNNCKVFFILLTHNTSSNVTDIDPWQWTVSHRNCDHSGAVRAYYRLINGQKIIEVKRHANNCPVYCRRQSLLHIFFDFTFRIKMGYIKNKMVNNSNLKPLRSTYCKLMKRLLAFSGVELEQARTAKFDQEKAFLGCERVNIKEYILM